MIYIKIGNLSNFQENCKAGFQPAHISRLVLSSHQISAAYEAFFKEYSYTYALAMKPPILDDFLHIQ
jgi:hypothetical protein